MRKIVSFILVSLLAGLTACASNPPIEPLPAANTVVMGVLTPPTSEKCHYLGPISVEYKGNLIGHALKPDEIRHRANILMRNEAVMLGANYVNVKKEDAQIAGAYNYQMITAVFIEADAFRCKAIPQLKN